ncbi:MAG TPA: hypothetical protein VGQ51_12480, partial [Puia sp.]|nr:hypothetical protein [Puia sp.]
MFLLIFGILLLIAGFVTARRTDSFKRYGNPLKLVGFLIALLGFSSASLVQIGAGEVGVQILFGK